jgi:hypothetical protein
MKKKSTAPTTVHASRNLTIGMECQLDELHSKLQRNLGEAHALTRLFAAAIESGNPEAAQLALAAYRDQAPDLRMKVMAGWAQPDWMPPFPKDDREAPFRLCLSLKGAGKDEPGVVLFGDDIPETGVYIRPRIEFSRLHELWPVRVEVLEGSSKSDVVKILKACANKVESEWESLISEAPEGW